MPKIKSNAFRKVHRLFNKTARAYDISQSDFDVMPTEIPVKRVRKLYDQNVAKNTRMRVLDLSASGGWVLEIDLPSGYKQYKLYFGGDTCA